MSQGQELAPPNQHAVSFYDHERDVVSVVARYLAEGLGSGDRVVVVATADHESFFEQALAAMGADAAAARRAGRYVVRDADEMLAAFMVNGSPDAGRFRATVGEVIRSAAADGARVRAFGEMVALLWERGNVTGAIDLESQWNDLARSEVFSLLCAYPTTSLGNAGLNELSRVCGLHSSVHAPVSYDAPSDAPAHVWSGAPDRARESEVFVPALGAVSAARRFVAGVLGRWGECRDLIDDAALVTSELATNAIRHGDSAFRTSVTRAYGVVRIAIEDTGSGWPLQRAATSHESDGRGMAIVEAIAHRSGCDPMPGGKVAWADLRR